ncbi:MAG TPA: STAS domain-containing protein [Acidimicrobiales bacterium]|nr:STAS domain-containing protein [Acidimicrobiales bacterium]
MSVSGQGLTIERVDYDDLHLVMLRGELDLLSAPQLRSCLEDAMNSTVVVDLSGLSFIDAAGLSVLVTARRRAETDGNHVKVTNPAGLVRRVFELAGLDELIE